MSKYTRMLVATFILTTLVFVACGPTTESPGGTNTSPPTTSGGDINLETKHSIYAPGDVITIIITNRLSVPIYTLDSQVSCSILSMEVKDGNNWEDVQGSGKLNVGCPLGRPPFPVKIEPGATTEAQVRGGYLTPALLPEGTYRFVLAYTRQPLTMNDITVPLDSTVTSQPISVLATMSVTSPPPTVAPSSGQPEVGTGTVSPGGPIVPPVTP